MARFANASKATAVAKLPTARRLAALVAFVHTLEASAQDDVLEMLETLLRDLFVKAEKADKQARMRSLKDLDALTTTLAEACAVLMDPTVSDAKLRAAVFNRVPREKLAKALEDAGDLVRPPEDVFYEALHARYARVRRFLPALLKHVTFVSSPGGAPVVEALAYLRAVEAGTAIPEDAPLDVVNKNWQRHVIGKNGRIEHPAYVFCVLDRLRDALKRRDVFVERSWRYADPRSGLLSGAEWETARPIVCRSLGYINMMGRYSFVIHESVAKGELRPLRDPSKGDA